MRVNPQEEPPERRREGRQVGRQAGGRGRKKAKPRGGRGRRQGWWEKEGWGGVVGERRVWYRGAGSVTCCRPAGTGHLGGVHPHLRGAGPHPIAHLPPPDTDGSICRSGRGCLSCCRFHSGPGRWDEVSARGQGGPCSPSPTTWQLVADALDGGLGAPPGQVGGF